MQLECTVVKGTEELVRYTMSVLDRLILNE